MRRHYKLKLRELHKRIEKNSLFFAEGCFTKFTKIVRAKQDDMYSTSIIY